ncbi:ESPR-type extended signal peptide-containing protein, partial [Gallibacterium sp. AGMB14963]|uniref:ESPR-type extended signal peptide-containing protein n=1 Tax=Gallibacterium faecale TaxID=3019086 RepID=UPI0022F1676D
MNKIFKILFNKRTNSFVVASELANSNGKASSTTDERKSTSYTLSSSSSPPPSHLLAPSKFATLLVFSSAMLASQAFAGHTQIGTHSTGGDTTVSGNNAVAIGEGATATGTDNAIAIGAKFHGSSSKPTEGAQALGDNSIAIGQASKASTSQSIAIGQYAEIADTATQSITIGANTKVSGASSIAIGGDDAKGTDYHTWQYDDSVGRAVDKKSAKFDATSAEGSVALAIGIKTQAKADGSIALGVVSTAGGKESISIGAKSATKGTNAIALGTAASGIANNAIALGTNAVANLEGSVVLGANSTTEGSATQIKTTDKAEVGGYVYDGFAGTIDSDGDLVSIGNNTAGGQRKIINVAAGEITKQSTEAINGSQLYAVIDKINKANNGEA